MKSWGLLVALLYVVIIAVVSIPLITLFTYTPQPGSSLGHAMQSGMSGYRELAGSLVAWMLLGMAFIAQAAFLVIPVNLAERRPVSKHDIRAVLMASALMTCVLILGLYLAIHELRSPTVPTAGMLGLGLLFLTWFLWFLIFLRWTKNTPADQIVPKQTQFLLRATILELLIAVPSHIIVRQRHDCCAGIETSIGISCGIAVMLFCFGPAVFLLFAKRFAYLNRNPKS